MSLVRRPVLRGALVAATVACGALGLAVPASAAPTTGTVTGVVTAGGKPLAGVTVQAGVSQLVGIDSVFLVDATATTRRDGSYTLAGIPAGSGERIQFVADGATGGTSATGYGDSCFGGDGSCATSGRELTIRAGRTTSGISAALVPAGGVQGRITDSLGRGVGGVPVYLYEGGTDQSGDGTAPARTATSDVNGNYAFPRLYPHSWGVCFGNTLGGLVGTPNRDGYVAKCRAGRTVVTSGKITTASTQLQGGGAVSGVVIASDTRYPVAGAKVYESGPGAPFNPPTVTTDANGRFRLGQLRPGTRQISIDAPPYFVETIDVTVTSFQTARAAQIVVIPAD